MGRKVMRRWGGGEEGEGKVGEGEEGPETFY